MSPFTYLQQKREKISRTYQELHQLAEPSWQEANTAAYLQSQLSQAGLRIQTYPGHYGFIAEIPGVSRHVIALRADMDALVQEVNGKTIANHSCGHDAHSTMVLYTALALASTNKAFPYTLRFIFQPAEEVAGGALQMIKDGALENVNWLFGIHLRPWMEVPNGQASPVIVHRSSATIRGKIIGRPAHAARPQSGLNPIAEAATLIRYLQEIDIADASHSITMTHLEAGNPASTNVIPAHAVFALDIRADSNETMELLQTQIDACMQQTNAVIQWEQTDYVPAATKNDNAINIATKAITEILGADKLVPVCLSPGGEDFHFYSQARPDIHATMIGLGCDLRPGLHDPQMSFDTNALFAGTKILTKILCNINEEETF